MMNGEQFYELAQIREQEYMNEATLRRAARRTRNHGGFIAAATRRLREITPRSTR